MAERVIFVSRREFSRLGDEPTLQAIQNVSSEGEGDDGKRNNWEKRESGDLNFFTKTEGGGVAADI